nr:hypothetical protein [Bifidobacterium primatium]
MVNLWIRNAVIGIMMPLVSMNPVLSHCAVLLVMSNSRMRCGSADVISVWLRMAVKLPTIMMTMGM